jgi:TP901 family phage tail tape measure protein
MANVTAGINVIVNTSQAQAQLAGLTRQISALNMAAAASGTNMANNASMLQRQIGSTNQFATKMVTASSSVDTFTNSLEKNKMSLGQYTKYAASQMPLVGKSFKKEWDMIDRVATDRVKKLQSQYVAMGKSHRGLTQMLQSTPLNLNDSYATKTAVAAQKQMLMNKLIDAGSTKMLNWGKNTQWAGRQLMVGFSLPLAALGAVAAKTFMEIDKASLALRRVYGDLSTSTAEVENNVAAMKSLGMEYTKYGITLKDTLSLAARVAATGAQGADLYAATEQSLRFATLGQMDYNTALDATISMQTAFGISSQDLAGNIDYLNAVENQTILTIQDMALAIPRVAPVIKGLGGDVQDLSVMMTAMREGGVSAEQGANALKSGLASLINPTTRAKEVLNKFGIDLQSMLTKNRGDVVGLVTDFGKALSQLDAFSQQQTLEQVFGKYQYARMGALFKKWPMMQVRLQGQLILQNCQLKNLLKCHSEKCQRFKKVQLLNFKRQWSS